MNRLAKIVAAGSLALVAAAATVTDERSASASFIDAGIEAGVQKRSLSDTNFKAGFAWQLHAELALLPPILMLGPYATFAKATPDVAIDGLPGVSFTTVGLRAKLKIPIPGGFKPYAVAGMGYVRGSFPDYSASVCVPGTTNCATRALPNANANFVEFVLGAGFQVDLAGPLALTAEFNWRPTTGYHNDDYQRSLAGAQTSGSAATPEPSRNGVSYTGMLGLMLSL